MIYIGVIELNQMVNIVLVVLILHEILLEQIILFFLVIIYFLRLTMHTSTYSLKILLFFDIRITIVEIVVAINIDIILQVDLDLTNQ